MLTDNQKRLLNSSVVVIVFLFILLLVIGIFSSEYKSNNNENRNIVESNAVISNYSIIIENCDKTNYICYSGRIIISVNNTKCYFSKISDPIYENVKNWLEQYYPINSEIIVSFNIKDKKCDNYISNNALFVSIILLSVLAGTVFIISIVILSNLYVDYRKNLIFEQV